jgi:hypothetical protein
VVLVSGEIDRGWRRLLDRIAEQSPSFEWHQLPHRRGDTYAWQSALTGAVPLLHIGRPFARYFLVSAACRGPFVPAYYPYAWPVVFSSLLDDGACLAATSVSCACASPPESIIGPTAGPGDCAHVEGCLLAFRADFLPEVSAALAACDGDSPCFTSENSCTGGGADALGRALTKRALIASGASGHGLGCSGAAAVQHTWAGVNLGDRLQVARACAVEADGERVEDHPLDVVFVDEGLRGANPDTLYQFTRMALGNVPWAVPIHVFCE